MERDVTRNRLVDTAGTSPQKPAENIACMAKSMPEAVEGVQYAPSGALTGNNQKKQNPNASLQA
jgi:hypothetical protein